MHRRDAPRSWSRGRAWTPLFPCSRTRKVTPDCRRTARGWVSHTGQREATQGRGAQDPDRPPPADPSHIRPRSAHRPSASRGRKTFRRLAGRSDGIPATTPSPARFSSTWLPMRWTGVGPAAPTRCRWKACRRGSRPNSRSAGGNTPIHESPSITAGRRAGLRSQAVASPLATAVC